MNECLKLVEQCSKSLCKSNATLVGAEVCHDFLINSLVKLNTNYAQILASNIKKRVLQRRTILSDIVCYLSSMGSKLQTNFNFYVEPSDEDIKTFIENHIQINNCLPSSSPYIIEESNQNSMSLVELLEIVNQPVKHAQRVSDIENELIDFRQRGVLGEILSQTLNTLLTISPTSVQCERIFSSCARIVTKFRSSMKPDFLNCLIFVKMLFRMVYQKN